MVVLIKDQNSYNMAIKTFEVEVESDKNDIDTSQVQMGSRVHVAETDKFYILNSLKQWVETSNLLV